MARLDLPFRELERWNSRSLLFQTRAFQKGIGLGREASVAIERCRKLFEENPTAWSELDR